MTEGNDPYDTKYALINLNRFSPLKDLKLITIGRTNKTNSSLEEL